MVGWILVGKKSVNLADVDNFISVFEKNNLPLQKIMVETISLCTDNFDGVFVNGIRYPLPDFIVPAFFGNFNFHSLCVVKMFESAGIFSTASYSCLVDTKDKLKSFLMVKGKLKTVLLPKTILFAENITSSFLDKNFSFPLIAKINHGSKGDGVCIINNFKELLTTANTLAEKFQDQILLQEFIQTSIGKDLRIIVCGGEIITAFLRQNTNDFKSNLNFGGTLKFIEPPLSLCNEALNIAKILDINLGSVDFLLGANNSFYFCEANSMPGITYSKTANENELPDPLEQIAKNIKKQINTLF